MKTINKQQLKKLHTLLSNAGMMEDKPSMILQYSNGRTKSSRELLQHEAEKLINALAIDDVCTKMKKKCIAICFALGWFRDGNNEEWKINYAKLDGFLKLRGIVKKPFASLNCKEVRLVLGQLEGVQKNSRNAEERRRIEQDFSQMMDELGIKRPEESKFQKGGGLKAV
ncbi:MAG: hypothetical protein KF775_02240 [Cyclobacteriaceae bacterium]|nr:hypothetical protein [Cyclobacteriaceae bacterium]